MRGEYLGISVLTLADNGSPPHAWGILVVCQSPSVYIRFTPTCVGNTAPRGILSSTLSVHPHMRGEYFFTLSRNVLMSVHPHMRGEYVSTFVAPSPLTGSPPHAWGIHMPIPVLMVAQRFTPTCVGNTGTGLRNKSRKPVHPHMRGEYSSISQSFTIRAGSPPHAWGIRFSCHFFA